MENFDLEKIMATLQKVTDFLGIDLAFFIERLSPFLQKVIALFTS